MLHKSSFTNSLVAILLVAVPTLSTTPAQAFGDYKSHEHPFAYIGSSYNQSEGNVVCRREYRTEVNSHRKGFSAYDGTVINGARHVWYHQINGECIANT
jgi:hypothetical protein